MTSPTMYIVRTKRAGPDGHPYERQLSAYSAEQARRIAALTWGGVDPEECFAVTLVEHLCGKAHKQRELSR